VQYFDVVWQVQSPFSFVLLSSMETRSRQ
jgi:hypothetical protein